MLAAFVPLDPMMVLSLKFNGTIISIVYIFVPVICGLLYYFLHINFKIPTIIHCLLAGVGWVVSVGSASAFLSSIAIFYLIFIIFLFGPMRTRKAAIVWLVGQCGLLLIAIASGLTHDA